MAKKQNEENTNLIKIHLFKSGEFASSNGQTMSFSDENMQEIVDSYSKDDEAPLCLGHVKNDTPAYGWVEKLEKAKDGVHAMVRVADDVKEAISKELYKKVSGSLYLPKTRNNPRPGKHYLKHIALLGATPPAIKGLKPIELSDECEGVLYFGDIEEENNQKEVAMPDPNKDTKVVKDEKINKEESSKTEEVSAEKEAERKAFDDEKEAFDAEKSAFEEKQKQAKSKDIDQFVGEAVKNGQIKVDDKADVKSFMESLDADSTLDFSDDKQETQMEFFKRIISTQKSTIDFSEVATAGNSIDFNDPSQVCEAILEAREEAAKKGIKLTEAEALEKIKGE